MWPIIILDVYLGTLLSNIADALAGKTDANWIHLGSLIGGGVLALVAVVFVTCMA
jgi:large-conductance mechanosensitive channel